MLLLKVICVCTLAYITCCSAMSAEDAFDKVSALMSSVTPQNCASKALEGLQLPAHTLPALLSECDTGEKMDAHRNYPNKALMERLTNLVFSRAMYYSFINQALNSTVDMYNGPQLLALYMSSGVDVLANPDTVTNSAHVYHTNRTQAVWYWQLNYRWSIGLSWVYSRSKDKTNFDFYYSYLEHFGVRSTANSREANTVDITDFATGDIFTGGKAYTPYTRNTTGPSRYWWPDQYSPHVDRKVGNINAHVYNNVHIRNKNIPFFGPYPNECVSQGSRCRAVKMTSPYYDCGRSNKWLVAVTAPVLDYTPKNIPYYTLRKPSTTSVVAIETTFSKLDINQCAAEEGEPGYSLFSGSHKCHNSTQCEPVPGFGFRRGGYQCACRPGFQYPRGQVGPFHGKDIEDATAKHHGQFKCVLIQEEPMVRSDGDKTETIHDTAFTTIAKASSKMKQLLDQMDNITEYTCMDNTPSAMYLEHHSTFNIGQQFEGQGRIALRLAHYISSIYQNWRGDCNDTCWYKHPISPEKGINITHIYGELLAAVMADETVISAGVFFDQNSFRYSTHDMYDGAYNEERAKFMEAFVRTARTSSGAKKYHSGAIVNDCYQDQHWFKHARKLWKHKHNIPGLKLYSTYPMIRQTYNSTKSMPYYTYPLHYFAMAYEVGQWSTPRFVCNDDGVMDWVTTYTIPFFDRDHQKKLTFSGIVTVDVLYKGYDINQCPGEDTDKNIFKNTAKCHYDSQKCVHVPGGGVALGSYKCECLYGFAVVERYRGIRTSTWVPGQLMEKEFDLKLMGIRSSYDALVCINSAEGLAVTYVTMVITWLFSTYLQLTAGRMV